MWHVMLTVDLILKISLVLFTLLLASKNHFKKVPYYSWQYWFQEDTPRIIGYCHYTVKIARVSDWYFFIFVILNKKLNVMCYCILNYYDNLILKFFILKCLVSLFFSKILNQWFLGAFYHNFSRQSKNDINFNFRFW